MNSHTYMRTYTFASQFLLKYVQQQQMDTSGQSVFQPI